MTRIRSAYSLLEVVIATALMAMLFGMVMQSLTSMRMFYLANTGHVLLQDQSRKALEEVLGLLGSSAWHLPMSEAAKVDLLDATLDRDLRYYPYVMSQTPNGRGQAFEAWHRSGSELVHPETWLDANPPDEWHLPSHELVFVRVATSAPVDDPKNLHMPLVNLNDSTGVTPFNDQHNAPWVDSMELGLAGGEIDDVRLRFERDTGGRIREYGLVVVPDPASGRNELQLRYFHRDDVNASGAGSTSLIKVISRHVDRMVAETSRTHPGLAPDQLRVTLYMSNTDQNGLRQQLVVTGTIAMRSTVDPEYSAEIDNWLGVPGDYRYSY